MHEFIKSIAGRLSFSGSATRAQAVFDQAMSKGGLRWGRKAKLVAGASLAVALRESHKSDSLRDIAYLLDEPYVALARAFTNVIDLLKLRVASADPAQHLIILENHLRTLIQSATTTKASLPGQLHTVLTPLVPRLSAVRQTASSLSTMIMRIPTLASLPTAPTACALFMLALEGELSGSLPLAGALAQAVGVRLGASKAVVMQRYKSVYDAVEECIREVPWLDAHERKSNGKGRSKVAKRVVVARGLNDVVQFREEIWRKKFESMQRPILTLEIDDTEDTEAGRRQEGYISGCAGGTSNTPMTPIPNRGHVSRSQSKKQQPRKSVHERNIAQTSQFLLNPLGEVCSRESSRGEAREDLAQHILTADPSALSETFSRPPTRLQLLATSRGGGEEDKIEDEELFEEGELEGLLRDPEEIETLRVALDWCHEDTDVTNIPEKTKKKRKREPTEQDDSVGNIKRTKRIDMDALARLLDPSTHLDDQEDHDPFDIAEVLGEAEHSGGQPYVFADGEEILEEWRPLSPGGGYDEDRYDI
ncbi:hypothetical protein EW026_g6545 [Hermanssonia centrifuga]|uniref:Uncharacterized protein n=1 Tax=Hermanssonia centrifuga TaxID=98765 RepID=A0A4S4KAN7_9APHY|nr:hypothetical protein EW026_g6545 [Hermanssonia centrifuga]